MLPNDQTPTFNLKAVVKETGLKPDTLRAWERRYDLPQPERTSGGHRLYSQRDIEILKWLIERQKEGLSISRAVDLWRQLEAENQDPLQVMIDDKASTPPTVVSPAVGQAIAELRQSWVSACLNFNEQQAEYVLTQAFALYSPEVVCIELLMLGLAEIGQGWYQGEITVQQEHFASALATRRLETLLAAAPAPTRAARLLVGCPPEEEHVFVPLLITLLLRRQGWEVVYLGANVPMAHFEKTINSARPKLVILSAQQLPTAATLLNMAQLLHRERVPLAYGGRIFNRLPALRSRIPGHFLGERIEHAPKTIERLLASATAAPAVETRSEKYELALASYRENRVQIEAEVWRVLEATQISNDHLTVANTNLSRYITAALTLGDMDFLGFDIDWVKGLLDNYSLPPEMMRQYLETYSQIAEAHLNARGKPIIEWLNQLLANFS